MLWVGAKEYWPDHSLYMVVLRCWLVPLMPAVLGVGMARHRGLSRERDLGLGVVVEAVEVSEVSERERGKQHRRTSDLTHF
jgi:hypothetical protein